MRLSLCLQTILVVCCYEANANHVCEAVKHEIITFILKREEELKTELENYDAPLESIEAKLKVKRCVDQMSYEDRCRVSGALREIVSEYDWQRWTEIHLLETTLFYEKLTFPT
uniref:Uncharacterized protein n=1 Tax=Rattus norvegicus TaxID=10116 RepID=A0ABK0LFU8_RAT|nr:prostatic steroid-binding protein C1-like isoform X2 [Rattus norvegicus]